MRKEPSEIHLGLMVAEAIEAIDWREHEKIKSVDGSYRKETNHMGEVIFIPEIKILMK